MSQWQHNNLSGSNSPLFGRKRPYEETITMHLAQRGNRNGAGPRPSTKGTNNPFYGMHHSPETLERMHQVGVNCWLDADYVSKQMRSRGSSPNQKELWLEGFIKGLSLPYSYVGDGQFILGGKCPDYLNTNGQKKLIELFGDYWHRNDNPQNRIDYFAQYGFQTLVIWEHCLQDEEILAQKLMTFDSGV